MTTGLHDTGEEFIVDIVFRQDTITKPASVSIGLYNDSTDALSDSSDIGAVTTEPAGSSYARQSATLDGADFTNQDNTGNWESIIADQTFDTSDSTQAVDSYFVVVSFVSDDTGDTSATNHLLFTGGLDASYDLSNVDSFTLSGSGLQIN